MAAFLEFETVIRATRDVARSTFARQASLVVLGDGMTAMATILAGVALARTLSVPDMGTYRQVQYLTLLITTIADIGLAPAVYRYWPEANDAKQGRLTLLLLGISLVSGALAAAGLAGTAGPLARLHGNPDLEAAIRVACVYPLASLPLAIIRPAMICRGRAIGATLFETVNACVPVLVLVLLSLGGASFLASLRGWVLACAARLFFVPLFLGRELLIHCEWPRLDDLRVVLGFSLPIQASRFPGIVLSYLDKIIMSISLTPAQFAVYSMGAREVPFVGQIGASVASVSVPKMVRARTNGGVPAVLAVWRRVATATALILFPIGAFCVVHAAPVMQLLFSSRYRESAGPFAVFACLTFVRFVDYGGLAKVLDQTGIILRSAAASAMAFLLLSPLLAWLGGPMGMSFAIVLSTGANAAFLLGAYRRTTGSRLTEFFPAPRLACLLAGSFASVAGGSLALGGRFPIIETDRTIVVAAKLAVHFVAASFFYGAFLILLHIAEQRIQRVRIKR